MCLAKPEGVTVDPDAEVSAPESTPQTVSVGLVFPSDRTEFLSRGLRLVFEHHGAPEQIIKEYLRQVSVYLNQGLSAPSDEEEWVRRCKYVLTYPLAEYLKNELPPPPPVGPFRPTGFLRRWLKVRTKVFSRKNTHLWYSIFQAKRCTIPFSDDMVEKTYDKHLKSLTKKAYDNELSKKRLFGNPWFQAVLEYIRKQLLNVYKFENFDDEMSDFPSEKPSSSACFERTRGGGGQRNTLRTTANLPTETLLGFDELHSMSYDPHSHRAIERRQASGLEFWQELLPTLRRAVESGEYSRPLKATIQGILEPNKCRVISKGESLPYYAMKSLQKALHGIMRKIPCFRLIGQTFCPTMVMDLVPEENPETYSWFSVDYSAATDELCSDFSNMILSYLLQDYSIAAYLAKKVLGPHDLYYPDPKKPGSKPAYRGHQTIGQLMGSILSFPILCLANLAVYFDNVSDRISFKKKPWQYVSRFVLVNGDDMLYAGLPHEWARHIAVSASVGLNMSVGKAYNHPIYSNVNSTSVHLNLANPNDLPYQIDFLNTGLFYGVRKVQGSSNDDPTSDDNIPDDAPFSKLGDEGYIRQAIGRSFRHWKSMLNVGSRTKFEGYITSIPKLLSGSLPGRQTSLLTSFIQENKEGIKTESLCLVRCGGKTRLRTRNLFLPEVLGGMGVKAPPDWKFRISGNDRKLASSLIRDLVDERVHLTPRPLIGKEYTDSLTEEVMPWIEPSEMVPFPSFVQRTGKTFSKAFIKSYLGPMARCWNAVGVCWKWIEKRVATKPPKSISRFLPSSPECPLYRSSSLTGSGLHLVN